MHHSRIETLETRIAPAALVPVDVFVDASTVKVTLSAGLLKVIPLTPAATDLDVSIEQLPDGSFLISDSTGDADLEDTADLHGIVKSLNATLSNGDDHLAISLDSAAVLAGGISIGTGLG